MNRKNIQSIYFEKKYHSLEEILVWLKEKNIEYIKGPIIMSFYYKFTIKKLDTEKKIKMGKSNNGIIIRYLI